jgi:hypothetical protein
MIVDTYRTGAHNDSAAQARNIVSEYGSERLVQWQEAGLKPRWFIAFTYLPKEVREWVLEQDDNGRALKMVWKAIDGVTKKRKESRGRQAEWPYDTAGD